MIGKTLPPYQRIARNLRDKIVGGEIQPGERIPSTRELVDAEGVAKSTIDKAMSVLRQEGLVESVHGVGMVVVEHSRVDAPRDMFMRTLAVTPKMRLPNERSEFRYVGLNDLPDKIAEGMGLTSGIKAICRSRIIYRSEVPTYLVTSWYPRWLEDVAPKLKMPEPIPEGTASYLQECTGRTLTRGRDRISVDIQDYYTSRDLNVSAETLMLYIQSSWFDQFGDVLEEGAYHILEGHNVSYEYELTTDMVTD